jgi:hypothetical protein
MDLPTSVSLSSAVVPCMSNVYIEELLSVSELIPSEAEITIRKLKKPKSLGTDQIPATFIQAGGETPLS